MFLEIKNWPFIITYDLSSKYLLFYRYIFRFIIMLLLYACWKLLFTSLQTYVLPVELLLIISLVVYVNKFLQ